MLTGGNFKSAMSNTKGRKIYELYIEYDDATGEVFCIEESIIPDDNEPDFINQKGDEIYDLIPHLAQLGLDEKVLAILRGAPYLALA